MDYKVTFKSGPYVLSGYPVMCESKGHTITGFIITSLYDENEQRYRYIAFSETVNSDRTMHSTSSYGLLISTSTSSFKAYFDGWPASASELYDTIIVENFLNILEPYVYNDSTNNTLKMWNLFKSEVSEKEILSWCEAYYMVKRQQQDTLLDSLFQTI